MPRKEQVIDLTGQRFGRLVVVKRAPNIVYKNGSYTTAWECLCDCGNKTIVAGGHLKKKKHGTKSCGCVAKENAKKQLNRIHKGELPSFKKYNTYNLSGEFGIGYTDNTDSEGRNYFYFDLEDFEKIKNYCWHFARNYVEAWDYLNKEKKINIRLHRLVMDCPQDMEVDHIYHNTYDNRKNQLRFVTDQENSWNKKGKIDLQNHQYPGIVKRKSGRYQASIGFCYKKYYLGIFDTFEEALVARKKAEEKYFGEYRYKKQSEVF